MSFKLTQKQVILSCFAAAIVLLACARESMTLADSEQKQRSWLYQKLLADDLQRAHDYPAARDTLTRALSHSSEDLQKAIIYQQLAQTDLQLQDYKNCLAETEQARTYFDRELARLNKDDSDTRGGLNAEVMYLQQVRQRCERAQKSNEPLEEILYNASSADLLRHAEVALGENQDSALATKLLETALKRLPADSKVSILAANIYNTLGLAYGAQKLSDKEIDVFRRELDILDRLHSADDNKIIGALQAYSAALSKSGRYPEAVRAADRLIAVSRKKYGERHQHYFFSQFFLVDNLVLAGQSERAAIEAEKLLKHEDLVDPSLTPIILTHQGHAFYNLGKYTEAHRVTSRAQQLFNKQGVQNEYCNGMLKVIDKKLRR